MGKACVITAVTGQQRLPWRDAACVNAEAPTRSGSRLSGELLPPLAARSAARPVLTNGKCPRACAGPGPPALACASPLRPGLTSSWSRPRASGFFRFPSPFCSFRVPVPLLSPSVRFARIPARSGRPLHLAGHHPPYAARRASQRTKVPRRGGRRSSGLRRGVLTSVQRTTDIDNDHYPDTVARRGTAGQLGHYRDGRCCCL